jgi:endonuclease YncB( thermonuclease family)
MTMHITAVAVIVAMILSPSFLVCCYASSGEIDATAVAIEVHDGDTFYLDRVINGSNTVRLADVNAPELGQSLSYEARDFLKELLLAKTVYLDIDDIYIYDYRGTGDRLVCVVYVDHNSTHYENVNEALWIAGLAEKKEYDNEFNADTWTLYVLKTDIPEFPIAVILLAFMLLTTVAATLMARQRHWSGHRLK